MVNIPCDYQFVCEEGQRWAGDKHTHSHAHRHTLLQPEVPPAAYDGRSVLTHLFRNINMNSAGFNKDQF